MSSETPKAYVGHLLSSALSDLKLTSTLDSLDITVPDPAFGDYSTNAALALAKKLGDNPKDIAARIMARIVVTDKEKKLDSVEEKGGFINFRLSPGYLAETLSVINSQKDRYGESNFGHQEKVVVEYFQNNVAKPPHVGHLRSAVIGDSILRILRCIGYAAVSDTHLGDWGTQFGILLLAFKTMGDRATVEKNPIEELNKLYVEMSAKIEVDPALREQGKAEFAKLEKGDVENRKLWQWFVMESEADFERYRVLLNIMPFDHNLGESFYEQHMPTVLQDLKAKKLLVESEGAQIVNLEDKNLGVAVVVKSDGATTYLLRDLATIKYRIDEMKIERALYVVDNRQAHHFRQVFEIALQAGYLRDKKQVQHVDFGFMSLPEGPISTRKGSTVSLQNLFDEAEKRALAIIQEKNPELPDKEKVAKQVALAAIKYFDLSHNRKTEIVFSWDKALSFEGNTGPYLQYAHARIHGILRKVGQLPSGGYGTAKDELEIKVLRQLNQFSDVLEAVAADFMPNRLCNYLFELSQIFNTFYEALPVLQEPDGRTKNFRLQLIAATAQIIKNGLNLLGIEAPEQM